MPNIATVLKDEITRIARREIRIETEGLKKASAQYRSEIAALKRRVATLEKQLAGLEKKTSKNTPPPVNQETDKGFRYSIKSLCAQRRRLGLSADDMGVLLGVSGQSIYKWETGASRPRQQQMAAIAAVRKLGKRDALAVLSGNYQ